MEQIRIIKEMRENDRQTNQHRGMDVQPRWMVWENVVGALSSNDGLDFLAVLEETVKIADKDAVLPRLEKGTKWAKAGLIMGDTFSVAWRIHDAQYFGVAQRRKRLCVLADFNGQSAGELLFELQRTSDQDNRNEDYSDIGEESRQEVLAQSEGLSGNSEQSGEKGQDASTNSVPGTNEASTEGCSVKPISKTVVIEGNGSRESHKGDGYKQADTMYTLNTIEQHAVCYDAEDVKDGYGVVTKGNGDAFIAKTHTALTGGGGQAGQGYPCVLEVYKKTAHPQNAEQGQGWKEADVNDTLNSFDNGEQRTPTVVVQGPVYALSGDSFLNYSKDICSTLLSRDFKDPQRVIYACDVYNGEVSDKEFPTMTTASGSSNSSGPKVMEEEDVTAFAVNQRDEVRDVGDKAVALQANPGMKQQTFLVEKQPTQKVYGICSYDSNSMHSPNPNSGIYDAETSRTLDNNGGNPACNQGGMAVVENIPREAIVLENHPADSRVKICEDNIVQTLSSRMGTGGGNVPMVLEKPPYVFEPGASYRKGQRGSETICSTLRADMGDNQPAVCTEENTEDTPTNQELCVRRLTPLECTRLQGFPDHWVDIGDWVDDKGKTHKDSDSTKYKALGNSIALPFWTWLCGRICKQYDHPTTMASLFDGISGFPLAFVKNGGIPVWSSEIEPFPLAVAKKHFGDDDLGIEGDYKEYL